MDELTATHLNQVVADVTEETRATYGEASQLLRGFRDLRVWQRGMDLVTQCYQVSDSFPKAEQFGLTSQVRRSSISVALNIAEGWGRNGKSEFARYVDIAFGSLTETEACLDVAVRLGYVSDSELSELRGLSDHLARMLHKLRATLRK